jgi:hypothetical protein
MASGLSHKELTEVSNTSTTTKLRGFYGHDNVGSYCINEFSIFLRGEPMSIDLASCLWVSGTFSIIVLYLFQEILDTCEN